jgi:hypothetical protein
MKLTDCHEQQLPWSDHGHDTLRVFEDFDHHIFFGFWSRLSRKVQLNRREPNSYNLPCPRGEYKGGPNKQVSVTEKRITSSGTHDAIHVQVQIIELGAIRIRIGNVEGDRNIVPFLVWYFDFFILDDRQN